MGKPAMSAGSKRRLRASGKALLASLLVHALMLAGALHWSPRARGPGPADQAPIEIEVRTAQPQPAPALQPPAEESPAPTSPPPAGGQRRKPGAPAPALPAPPLPAPAPSAPPLPAPPPSAPAPAPAPEAAAAPALLRMRAAPSFTMDQAAVDRLTRDGVIAPPADALPPAAPVVRKPSFSEKVAALAREDGARANVDQGHVHPLLYDYVRDARKVFTPREEVVELDPRAPNTVGRTFRSWGRTWLRDYQDKLRGVRQADRTAAAPGKHSEAPSTDLLAQYNEVMRAAEKHAEDIACQVCVVLRPGAPPQVMLAHSSGNAEVDRTAVEALERAVARRPQNKDLRPERACYKFSARVYRIPPLPMVGCNFDEVSLTAGCYYPGKQVYKTTVDLESVDYGS
jgi:outer membrane biosynthesis protein TonB